MRIRNTVFNFLVFMYLELFPELDRGRGGHAVHAVFKYFVFMYLELFPELDRGHGGQAVHASMQATHCFLS
jgi:hypothetical protein